MYAAYLQDPDPVRLYSMPYSTTASQIHTLFRDTLPSASPARGQAWENGNLRPGMRARGIVDSRSIGMRRSTLLRVVAKDFPELLRLYVGRILNLNRSTLCDHLSCGVWSFDACETRALVKNEWCTHKIGVTNQMNNLPPLLYLSYFFRRICTFVSHLR